MSAMGERLGCPYGLSDHTPDIYTSIAAVALGASVVEKHFTLSKRLYGPDHHASLEPEELRRLVEGVRQVEPALGSGLKERDESLNGVRATFEKSVVSATAIPAGSVIDRSMLVTKRPGTGIPALRLPELVGRRAARDIEANELIAESDLD
jgi:sialic acid synthase SpsE